LGASVGAVPFIASLFGAVVDAFVSLAFIELVEPIESLLVVVFFAFFFVDFFAAVVSLFMAVSLFAAGAGVAAGAGAAFVAGAGAGVAGAAVCATAENEVTAQAAISAVRSLFILSLRVCGSRSPPPSAQNPG